MEKSHFQSVVLLAAMIGAGVLNSQQRALGFGEAAVGNLILLLVLFAFDSAVTRSGIQSIAFSSVGAFCLLTPLLFLADVVLGVAQPQGASWMLFGVWLITTLVLFGVDRFRASSGHSLGLADAGLAASGPMNPLSSSARPSTYRPAPIRVEPAVTAARAYDSEDPVPAQVSTPDGTEAKISDSVVPQAAPTTVTAIPPGKEALIYLNLVGEGLNVLRTVRAENLGRDYYRIADVMPEGEQWEFSPGMVVRCRKKNLSNGKHMVAYEEAPRAL